MDSLNGAVFVRYAKLIPVWFIIHHRADCFKQACGVDSPHGVGDLVGRIQHPRLLRLRQKGSHRQRPPAILADFVRPQDRARFTQTALN